MENINKDDILVLIWKIYLIAFLHVRVVNEHPFNKTLCQLGYIRSVIMKEGHTTKLVLYDPRRYQDTISRRQRSPFRARGSIYLFSYFIVNFLTHTCLRGSLLISFSLLGFPVGSSLFGILFVKPFFFVNLYFYEHV